MKKKIIITGSDGQLGQALQKAFDNKYELLPTVKKSLKLAKNNRNICELNVADKKSVSDAIKYFHPDIIINCAAYTDVDGNEINKDIAHQVNVVGLYNLLEVSDKNTYFIQISSDYVFDGINGPYDEEDKTYPVNYYGKTKLEAENILRGFRRKSVIIRPNVLYSENLLSKGNFFAWVYKSLFKKKTISVVTDQISNPASINDVVRSIFQSIIMHYEGILHIGSDNFISRYAFALQIAEIFGFEKSLVNSIDTQYLKKNVKNYIAERPLHSGLKIDKIEKYLNITTYSTEYSLNRIKKNFNK